FADQRVQRPSPIGGSPVAVGSAGAEVVVCETGVGFTGTPPAGSVPPGATLVARSTPPARVGPAGAPLPTMERLELAVSRVASGAAQAVVGTTPALGRYHELLPHQLGHPGAPAAVEVHGAGVALNGPAAVQVGEYVRGRTAGDTASLAQAAFSTPFADPPAPSTPSAWAAVLATVAAEVEAEYGVAELG